jgi:hypothetical protein
MLDVLNGVFWFILARLVQPGIWMIIFMFATSYASYIVYQRWGNNAFSFAAWLISTIIIVVVVIPSIFTIANNKDAREKAPLAENSRISNMTMTQKLF